MPDAGTTEPSVRFFVSVAAEALILENDTARPSFERFRLP
jgi:hypothetical protein